MEELDKGYEFTKAQIAELESLRAWKAEIEKQEPVGCLDKRDYDWHKDNDKKTSLGFWRTSDWKSVLNLPNQVPMALYAAPVISPDVAKLQEKLRVAREALKITVKLGFGTDCEMYAKEALATIGEE